jgi:hypothetical protein
MTLGSTILVKIDRVYRLARLGVQRLMYPPNLDLYAMRLKKKVLPFHSD